MPVSEAGAMGKHDLNVAGRIEMLSGRLEQLVRAGHTQAVPAIAHLIELKSLEREFSDGEIIIGNALVVIEVLVDALEAKAAPTMHVAADFQLRARQLCADLLELGQENNIDHWNQEQVNDCRAQARALLIGVDEN